MAGRVKSGEKAVKIDSPSARAKLKARGTPYYVEALSGLHLGYRKGARRGVWVTRRWLGDKYSVETIAIADDLEPSDGERVLTFDQAKRRAIALATEAAKAAKGLPQRRRAKTAPATVADALTAYLQYLDREKKSGHNSRVYANGSILPKLGGIALRDLTREILSGWLHDLAASPRKTRAPAGVLAPPVTDEEKRRRRSSANRIWTILRAALNMAFVDGHVASDSAWRRVRPLAEAVAARVRWLSSDEMRRLTAAAPEPFKSLVVAALHSGCRFSELTRLLVEDFDARSDSLLVRVSKSGKHRQIPLTRDAADFFSRLCTGRGPREVLLQRADGAPWRSGDQDKPMRAACAKAGMEHATFHCLRHTFASHSAMDGVSSMMIAKALGHSDTAMVEKFYAHLCPKGMRETIQSLRKPLGLIDDDDSNIVALRR
jgi:prepilin-type processing-associated H-X9-DG protein